MTEWFAAPWALVLLVLPGIGWLLVRRRDRSRRAALERALGRRAAILAPDQPLVGLLLQVPLVFGLQDLVSALLAVQ